MTYSFHLVAATSRRNRPAPSPFVNPLPFVRPFVQPFALLRPRSPFVSPSVRVLMLLATPFVAPARPYASALVNPLILPVRPFVSPFVTPALNFWSPFTRPFVRPGARVGGRVGPLVRPRRLASSELWGFGGSGGARVTGACPAGFSASSRKCSTSTARKWHSSASSRSPRPP